MRDVPKQTEFVEKQKRSMEHRYYPCPVCGRRMSRESLNPYCSVCAVTVRNWEKGKMTTPCPIVQIDGVWQYNPARKAAA